MSTIHMSVAEFTRQFGSPRGEQKKKPNKHHNCKVYVFEDGFVSETKDVEQHGNIVAQYDSKKEFMRHKELLLLQRAGKISELKTQVPMVVAEEFTDKDGKKHRAIVYRADFTYTRDGKEIVEDVKGLDKKTGKYQTTEGFRIKWKLLQAKYPEKIFELY